MYGVVSTLHCEDSMLRSREVIGLFLLRRYDTSLGRKPCFCFSSARTNGCGMVSTARSEDTMMRSCEVIGFFLLRRYDTSLETQVMFFLLHPKVQVK